jgi:hypothetical protein
MPEGCGCTAVKWLLFAAIKVTQPQLALSLRPDHHSSGGSGCCSLCARDVNTTCSNNDIILQGVQEGKVSRIRSQV